MGLCTRQQVKDRLGVAALDTEHDGVLDEIVSGVSAGCAAWCGRMWAGAACMIKTTLTQLLSVGGRTHVIQLAAYPVVSISEIKEALYGAYDDADVLVENTDYQLDAGAGRLIRIGFWMPGINGVRVTYTGGWTPAGEDVGEGETAIPSVITAAAIRQAVHEFQQRRAPGKRGESVQGAGVTYQAGDALLPGVKEALAPFRRLM